MSQSPAPVWKWYAGQDDAHYELGPCDSRDEAIDLARDEGWEMVHICEAWKRPYRLASFFDVGLFLEAAEEEAYHAVNPDGSVIFDVTDGQRERLSTVIRTAIDKWQQSEGLTFGSFVFGGIRNLEAVDLVGDDHG